ncbi:helix-turn-helix transcriptional regulator [Flavobacterium sp.]|uniref:helix-turn-helix domain-containing protein n=1 Tax=Flavobacterium sp. TaxID=239 RepID=UPI00286E272F|nr:helix-turn-helix transcriptional regulator [Flavobacterium sp.]
MNNQEQLLKQIRKQLSQNESINDVIASVLNISYDASHRRVSGKSKFSIDETIQLANHFNISLDNLFSKKGKVIVEKTIEISNQAEMQLYFENSAEKIEALTSNPNTLLYYSAKDIPLFYFMDATILSKFKAYVWLNLINSETAKVSFENFVINESFLESMTKLKTAYEKVEVKEIWNDTTINSSLQQILYFYESELLSFKSANLLFEDLKRILNTIKEKSNKPNSKFKIYYNELVMLNNNLLFETNQKLTLFVPYTLLGYFITENEDSCQNVYQWLNQQILNSKPLNVLGIKEQNLFFNKAIRKINYYMEQLNNQIDILF